jgi:hypothetical protein
VPRPFARNVDATTDIPSGFFEYSNQSDWPRNWQSLRSKFPMRLNFGQWLRWEAALEEITAYYRVPFEFRLDALRTFGSGVERIVNSSRAVFLLPPQQRPGANAADDEELAERTIFPFVVRRGDRVLSLEDCRVLYRTLARGTPSHDNSEPGIKPSLIGQPVALGRANHSAAALRIGASARLVSESFSSDEDLARRNLQRALDDVAHVVTEVETLLSKMESLEPAGVAHEA